MARRVANLETLSAIASEILIRLKTIELSPYNPEAGIQFEGSDECNLQVDFGSPPYIRGNAAALEALAQCLLTMAQQDVPPGVHVHLDEFMGVGGELDVERV